jgi:hypothetical protein
MNAHVNLDWRKAGDIGLYTVPMAARILREDSGRIRSWINGAAHSQAPPIIHRQLPLIAGKTVLGFLDLVEARFIKHFKDLGLSSQTIRKIAERRPNIPESFLILTSRLAGLYLKEFGFPLTRWRLPTVPRELVRQWRKISTLMKKMFLRPCL